jgi:uncharacterized protein YndB with AHSA1/START domain
MGFGQRRRALGVAVLVIPAFMVAAWSSRAEEPGSSGPLSERILRKEAVVHATPQQVWNAWTTSAGIASFFAPDSNIELRPGGAFELFMGGRDKQDERGKSGTAGCKLLSFVPNEMLSFEWSFPPVVPTLRNSDAKTHVVINFDDLGDGQVRVRFAQLGWQDGEDWQKGFDYFDKAWTWVFGQLEKRFNGDAAAAAGTNGHSAGSASGDGEHRESQTDGRVTITTIDGPFKRQEFAIELDAPAEKVWRMLATTEGLRELVHPEAMVDLRPWGDYNIWYGAGNKVLSYVPDEMLSITGSAPEEFPNVRKGGTWGVYLLKPIGADKTRLRLISLGWADHAGEAEWDQAFTYFLKGNAQYLNSIAPKIEK